MAAGTAKAARFWTSSLVFISFLSGGGLAFFLIRSVNSALRRTVQEISEGAGQILSATGLIGTASQALARNASEQAASLEETSASSTQIDAMAGKNAANSQATVQLVTQSQQRFADATQSLEQLVKAMCEIEASSNKVVQIIKVIDGIAFQTNILALNAAVEAARAGESGAGFAVVADEVRNLAQRCAQAARDTSSLIEESIKNSSGGRDKLGRVTQAIQDATEVSGKVQTLIQGVSLGSAEQARGIVEVSKTVVQLERLTQATAASAEETAAAAEQLTSQAEELWGTVQRLTTIVNCVGVGR